LTIPHLCPLSAPSPLIPEATLLSLASEPEKSSFYSEIAILSLLKHENIIQMVGFVNEPLSGCFSILFEWVDGSDLHKFIHREKGLVRLSGSMILDVVLQIAQGMCYLHQNDVLHRDLKTNNIMYDYHSNRVKWNHFLEICFIYLFIY
jgi:serine/threonine protein kinase